MRETKRGDERLPLTRLVRGAAGGDGKRLLAGANPAATSAFAPHKHKITMEIKVAIFSLILSVILCKFSESIAASVVSSHSWAHQVRPHQSIVTGDVGEEPGVHLISKKSDQDQQQDGNDEEESGRSKIQELFDLSHLFGIESSSSASSNAQNETTRSYDIPLMLSVANFCRQHPDECKTAQRMSLSECSTFNVLSGLIRIICIPYSWDTHLAINEQRAPLDSAIVNDSASQGSSVESAKFERVARWATEAAESNGVTMASLGRASLTGSDSDEGLDELIELLRHSKRRPISTMGGERGWRQQSDLIASPLAGGVGVTTRGDKAPSQEEFSFASTAERVGEPMTILPSHFDGANRSPDDRATRGQVLRETRRFPLQAAASRQFGSAQARHPLERQQQPPLPHGQRFARTSPATFRVSYEEAERFLQAQRASDQLRGQLQSSDLLGPVGRLLDGLPQVSPLFPEQSSLMIEPTVWQPQKQWRSQRTSRVGPPPSATVRLNRSGQPADQPKRNPEGSASNSMQTVLQTLGSDLVGGDGGHLVMAHGRRPREPQQQQQQSTEAGSTTTPTSSSSGTYTEEGDDSPMQCRMRNFTFRATKEDESNGLKCWDVVTASICYGGCDSGEIADWIFPHKKSIHKVCRHGARIRRRVLLRHCNSQEAPDGLREYHYVDARDCVCRKCTSVDTTCLGTMTRPHLQTLAEAAAAVAMNGAGAGTANDGDDK